MAGETNLQTLLKNMTPSLEAGDYVYCVAPDVSAIDPAKVIGLFRETEGVTVILRNAMTIYYSFMGWGEYRTDFEIDKVPYSI